MRRASLPDGSRCCMIFCLVAHKCASFLARCATHSRGFTLAFCSSSLSPDRPFLNDHPCCISEPGATGCHRSLFSKDITQHEKYPGNLSFRVNIVRIGSMNNFFTFFLLKYDKRNEILSILIPLRRKDWSKVNKRKFLYWHKCRCVKLVHLTQIRRNMYKICLYILIKIKISVQLSFLI